MNADDVVMFALDEIDEGTQIDLVPWWDEVLRAEEEALAIALQSLDRMDAPN